MAQHEAPQYAAARQSRQRRVAARPQPLHGIASSLPALARLAFLGCAARRRQIVSDTPAHRVSDADKVLTTDNLPDKIPDNLPDKLQDNLPRINFSPRINFYSVHTARDRSLIKPGKSLTWLHTLSVLYQCGHITKYKAVILEFWHTTNFLVKPNPTR